MRPEDTPLLPGSIAYLLSLTVEVCQLPGWLLKENKQTHSTFSQARFWLVQEDLCAQLCGVDRTPKLLEQLWPPDSSLERCGLPGRGGGGPVTAPPVEQPLASRTGRSWDTGEEHALTPPCLPWAGPTRDGLGCGPRLVGGRVEAEGT